MIQPELEQTWTHKQLGGVYTVAEIDTGKVVMVQLDSGRIFRCYIEQLNEHFRPTNATKSKAGDTPQTGG